MSPPHPQSQTWLFSTFKASSINTLLDRPTYPLALAAHGTECIISGLEAGLQWRPEASVPAGKGWVRVENVCQGTSTAMTPAGPLLKSFHSFRPHVNVETDERSEGI
jgi:hypothetical protein